MWGGSASCLRGPRCGSARVFADLTSRPSEITFSAFEEIWRERRGAQLVRSRDNEYRLKKIKAFVFSASDPPQAFGDKQLTAITTDDIEAFRDARRKDGLSPVTVNHDLKLLRKMFNWGIRKGYVERTPFKIGTESAITLEKEIPRAWRFEREEDEQKLLDAADPHLRGVLVALLDSACRVGEVLSLQWKDVNLGRKEILIEAVKAKTRTARIVPISTRLLAVLEMRRLNPAGKEFGPDAYVFGNEVGEQAGTIGRPGRPHERPRVCQLSNCATFATRRGHASTKPACPRTT